MIYYLVPESKKPSWGLAILYYQVNILCKNSINACVVVEKLDKPHWFQIEVPFETVSNFRKKIRPDDFIIVPEVMVNFSGLKKIRSRKIVFIQAGAYLFHFLPPNETHLTIGFEQAWVIMPHLKSIAERYTGLRTTVIPPFIAPYFLEGSLKMERQKKILMYPKYDSLDYSIVKHIVSKYIDKIGYSFLKNIFFEKNWSIKDLKNLTHLQVAKEMKSSAFFISLNCFEALNTSVVEAMASGCIVFCYEGFGPKDYLSDKENAFVFMNNEPYKLAEAVCYQINHYFDDDVLLSEMRKKAHITASTYSIINAEKALLNFFQTV
jgi:hypothetical protein